MHENLFKLFTVSHDIFYPIREKLLLRIQNIDQKFMNQSLRSLSLWAKTLFLFSIRLIHPLPFVLKTDSMFILVLALLIRSLIVVQWSRDLVTYFWRKGIDFREILLASVSSLLSLAPVKTPALDACDFMESSIWSLLLITLDLTNISKVSSKTQYWTYNLHILVATLAFDSYVPAS